METKASYVIGPASAEQTPQIRAFVEWHASEDPIVTFRHDGVLELDIFHAGVRVCRVLFPEYEPNESIVFVDATSAHGLALDGPTIVEPGKCSCGLCAPATQRDEKIHHEYEPELAETELLSGDEVCELSDDQAWYVV